MSMFSQGLNAAKSDQLCLNPNSAWSYSQAADTGLPDSYNGSAQIINLSFQVLPVVIADLYAGSFSPPPAPNANASCNSSVQPTVTPTATPSGGPTTSTATPTRSPTVPLAGWRVLLPAITQSDSSGW